MVFVIREVIHDTATLSIPNLSEHYNDLNHAEGYILAFVREWKYHNFSSISCTDMWVKTKWESRLIRKQDYFNVK